MKCHEEGVVLIICAAGELAMAATMQCPEVECGVPFYGAVADASTLAKPLQVPLTCIGMEGCEPWLFLTALWPPGDLMPRS